MVNVNVAKRYTRVGHIVQIAEESWYGNEKVDFIPYVARNWIGTKMSDLIDREKFIYTLIFSENRLNVETLHHLMEYEKEIKS